MLYENRARAEVFGVEAERYDRARPGYPPALIDTLLDGGVRDVLDVGCGTGIASRLFTARGCAVLGVEPDARMAAVAAARGIAVEVASFESWAPGGRRFDLVASAQAWHWVDPIAGAARAAAVLRPGGRIGLFWNFVRHDPELYAALSSAYQVHAPRLAEAAPAVGLGEQERIGVATTGLLGNSAFVGVATEHFTWSHRYSRDEWLDLLPTHSDHQLLPPDQRARLLKAVGAVIDARGGSLDVDYEVVLVHARRTGEAAKDRRGGP